MNVYRAVQVEIDVEGDEAWISQDVDPGERHTIRIPMHQLDDVVGALAQIADDFYGR